MIIDGVKFRKKNQSYSNCQGLQFDLIFMENSILCYEGGKQAIFYRFSTDFN